VRLVPFYFDDPDFIDCLLEQSEPFRRIGEDRRKESEARKVSSLEDVRKRLQRK
jgi:hypothetical protein